MKKFSLVELSEIFNKSKFVILSIVAVFTICGILYSVLLMDNAFESEAILKVTPIRKSSTSGNLGDLEGIINFIEDSNLTNAESISQQIKIHEVMNMTASELKMDMEDKNVIEVLRNKIDIGTFDESNFIYIKFTDSDGKTAVRGANAVTDNFIEYISNEVLTQYQSAAKFISTQHAKETQIYETSIEELKGLKANNESFDELQLELNENLSQISSYKKQLSDINIEINSLGAGLEEAILQLQNTDEFKNIVKAVGSDALIMSALAEKNYESLEEIAELTMIEQVPNDSYAILVDLVNEYKVQLSILNERLEGYNYEIDRLRIRNESIEPKLIDLSTKIADLNDNIESSGINRELLRRELNLIEAKIDAGIDELIAVKISEASEFKSVGISKLTVVGMAVAAGIIISILAAFFLNSWREDKAKKDTQSNDTH